MTALVQTMLPIALVVLAGVVARMVLDPDVSLLAKINLYVLSPALVFNCLVNARSTGREMLQTGTATVVMITCLMLLASLWSRMRDYKRTETSGFFLATVFSNAGNFGLPVVFAVMGREGLDFAIPMIVVQQTLMFSLGVYIAGRSHKSIGESFFMVFKMPSIYAVLLAYLHRNGTLVFADVALKVTSLMTEAAIPLFLILLGIQISRVKLHLGEGALLPATLFRLVAAPAVALAVARLLMLGPMATKVFVLESAMPTAVITTMLAIEYNSCPELVSSVTLVTTCLSVLSLPLLIMIM